jgi:all-trans-8'-apo-beta-carotenal 15,15'-oxygenase
MQPHTVSAASTNASPQIPDPRAARVPISENLPREHGFEPLRVEGQIPTTLRGTLYRQGPALFELFGRRYGHIFEGDGAVTAVRVEGNEAFGAVRVVESEGLRQERLARRMLYGFSAPWYSRLRYGVRKNVANTSIFHWQGRLFGLVEAALPTEIAPSSLSTLGETDLGGVIRGPFSAHPHFVPSRRALYNFGLRSGRTNWLDLYELPQRGQARCLGSLPLDGAPMLHDFIATDHYLIFFLCPVRLNIATALLPLGGFESLYRWKPELGTEVLVVPIDAPERAVRFREPAFWVWHFANAFEQNGKLMVDFVRYDDFSSFFTLAPNMSGLVNTGRLTRAELELDRRRMRCEQLWNEPCEFPRVRAGDESRSYDTLWVQVEGERHGVGRLSPGSGAADVWELPSHQRASEPVPADRYLLSLVYDAELHQSYVAVLDPERLTEGPVARIWFDHHIPITFHGNWVPNGEREETNALPR